MLGDWDRMVDVHADGTESAHYSIPLNSLDVLVHRSAWEAWGHGQYRQAVANAAASLNKFTQDRLGRHDVYDSALMLEAFTSADPAEGKPRLRCPGNPNSPTVKAMQEGAMHYSRGAFMAIRNPAVHWTENGNPATAGAHLAALSVIAQWVRYWNKVERTPPTPGPETWLSDITAP